MFKNGFLMKNKSNCMLVILCMLGSIPTLSANQLNGSPVQNSFSNYQLGVGDKVKIQVYGEEELGLETELTDAGTITYPLLGEIRASGMTIGELTLFVTDSLKGRYLTDPKVTINVTEYRDYYISGEVEKPGAYHYEPGLTVHKAVSIAGGFTERASRTSITVVADDDTSHTPQDVVLDMPISPGDVITVEESFF